MNESITVRELFDILVKACPPDKVNEIPTFEEFEQEAREDPEGIQVVKNIVLVARGQSPEFY